MSTGQNNPAYQISSINRSVNAKPHIMAMKNARPIEPFGTSKKNPKPAWTPGRMIPAHSFSVVRGLNLTLSAPTANQITTTLKEPIARCLSAAFSSGPWAETPMPLGDSHDRHSARGIVAELGPRAQTLLASPSTNTAASISVLGCVIGSILDEDLIDRYGLEPFGATPGDALFAYIGLKPSVQGRRVQSMGDDRFHLDWKYGTTEYGVSGTSLASLLFSRWLKLPAIRQCPRVFIRTREVLTQIQSMAERNGFQYCGKFYLDFHGKKQDRLVYKRTSE